MKNQANFIVLFVISTILLMECANNVSKTPKLVHKIAVYNKIESARIGSGGELSQQYVRFQKLKEKASVSQLRLLTKDSNAVVRAYSFWALAKNKNEDLEQIILEHKSDTTLIEYQFGCFSSSYKVRDFMLEIVNPKNFDFNAKKINLEEIEKIRKEFKTK